jgi:lipopolysaccharide/colanic/teichoic acid biosynthesis glycosyltransferase
LARARDHQREPQARQIDHNRTINAAPSDNLAAKRKTVSSFFYEPRFKFALARRPIVVPAWKRAIDLACCAIALPALCLVTAVVALLHRIFSPGPVLYKQERVGHKGSRFYCYKFRTMHVASETCGHREYLDKLLRTNAPMTKLDSRDSRLIPGGWIIRALGLDELPQIVNVLNGDMSIVGPRPCLPYEYENYSPRHRERFNAVPGLTGLWQVSGKNRTTFEEMIRLDVAYAKEASLWLDLRIILMTVPALLVQVGDTRKSRQAANARNSAHSAAVLVSKETVNMHGG